MEMQGLFEAIMDSAILLDKAGRIVYWSSGASGIFGYSRKEVSGRSVNLIYDRNYPFPKIIQDLHINQKKWAEETAFIHKNGLKGFCLSNLVPLVAPEQQNKAMALLMHQNISQFRKTEEELSRTKVQLIGQLQQMLDSIWQSNYLVIETLNSLDQAEKRLRESELRFRLLAENTTDVISRHAPDGTYLYVSPSCQVLMGYRPDQLVNQNIFKFVFHDDLNKIKKAFMKRRGEQLPHKTIVYRIKRKEGEFRWFESNVRLILDEQTRHLVEVQLSSHDITDRILDKKARLRGQQLAHVFRLSTMEEMASGMAHEISQPLAAIVNYTRGCVRHLENNQCDQAQLQQVMEKAVAQAERAGEIVQRLKNFFCKGQLIKTSCKLNNVLREAVSLIKNELVQSKTKVDFDSDKELPFIFIDKIQIQQVLLNLLQNAIEAMNEAQVKEKRIRIQTRTPQRDAIEITVTDTGPGFSKEVIHKVFMPFFTTKAHGRGMGLAICRSIIEAHGGQFTVNPNWIRFTLPISI
jgi:PAS domain S-box-containing protein